ncbi:MAG TPA: glucose 1-dehydrogenase [Acidimicrobiia bacterium]|jgi:3-oxoacyl-[acyl-carrier protein] reductase|nr:glucose 1-dehydrogenase [Acidimicrobiia bacterium]
MGRLDGKTIVITGSGQGLGRAYADAVAAEGAAVVIAEVKADAAEQAAKQIIAAGGRAVAVPTDVTRADDCRRMAEVAVAEFGTIDVLINNAAIFEGAYMRPMEEISEADWDRMMAVNVKGTWQATVACLPEMKARRRGRIINIASSVALIGPPLLLHYTASKGAVEAMTRAMARELGEDNIRVTAVSPGMCATPALDTVLPDPIMGDMFLEQQAIKERMQPADVAPLIVYLCSDDSGFVVGQNWVIDGGFIFH